MYSPGVLSCLPVHALSRLTRQRVCAGILTPTCRRWCIHGYKLIAKILKMCAFGLKHRLFLNFFDMNVHITFKLYVIIKFYKPCQ